jgi:hypothetical protein
MASNQSTAAATEAAATAAAVQCHLGLAMQPDKQQANLQLTAMFVCPCLIQQSRLLAGQLITMS